MAAETTVTVSATATATVTPSRYAEYCEENNVTLVQSFVRKDLKALVEKVLERDEIKLGAFVEWCVAVGVNEAKLTDEAGLPVKFDMAQLQPRVRKARETIKDLRAQLAELQAQVAAAKMPAPTPPGVQADPATGVVA